MPPETLVPIKCQSCHKVIAEAGAQAQGALAIKCKKCGHMNRFTLEVAVLAQAAAKQQAASRQTNARRD